MTGSAHPYAPVVAEGRSEVRPPRFVGQRLRRTEDHRLITGRAQYVGDLHLPGTLHVAILRSIFAHADVLRMDASAADATEGVVAVVTAADLEGKMGPFVEAARTEISSILLDKIGPTLKSCPMPVLAQGRVFWVGQPVAAVVAEDRYVAEDALERIEVEYEPLPAVADPEWALSPDAPILHPELGDNVQTRFTVSAGDVDAAFAAAPRTLEARFTIGRMAANAMETRGILATYDDGRDELTVWDANARPHLVRTFIAEMLTMPADAVHVIGPDMGGSFGTGMFPEDVLIPFLARELERPVRWIEDRRESLANTRHARDQLHDVAVAFDHDGTILGIKDRYLVDAGAYNTYAITVSYNSAAHLRNQFAIDHLRVESLSVLTNKAPVTPVRGAGRPEVTFVMDRLVGLVANELGLDPVDVRRRNLIRPEQMPYPMGMPYRDGVDIVYDRADFPDQLDKALELFGAESFRRAQGDARAQGRRLGLGVSSYVEGSGYGPHEGALIRIDASGHVTVHTGARPHGQGLETSLAQICADQLGVQPEDVTVRGGDTATIAHGIGTFASRSAVTAGSAVGIAAQRLRKKVLAVAGEVLETDPSDLELGEGTVVARGSPDRAVSLAEVARAAQPGPRAKLPAGMEPGLEVTHYYVPPTVTFASGTHVVGVEVDEETGFVKLLRYVTVDECGQMLNPMIVEGQIHGGVAHGIGNALYEETVYDAEGQLLTGTYMDYLMPTAAEVPPIEVGHQEFRSELNPFGIKGCGEGGAVSPPAAIANAIVDALAPLPVHLDRVPLSPERLLRLIEEAEASTGAD
ncbi:MAG TPA: xanthine dehydrogenase family protein molybdopterin-binding subunit [Actinomycetota bacterium]|nr:xanthine dehydrogenase family protein molybdopterin-binding subunit [Actinomycetota bacterium]